MKLLLLLLFALACQDAVTQPKCAPLCWTKDGGCQPCPVP
jgi:hypothetical protein